MMRIVFASKHVGWFVLGLVIFVIGFVGWNFFGIYRSLRTEAIETSKPEVMVQKVLEWGRLADFPKTSKNLSIATEGSAFTRTFLGSFDATKEEIELWISLSPGIQEGVSEGVAGGTRYTLKTIPRCSYGEVLILNQGTRVKFKISWS